MWGCSRVIMFRESKRCLRISFDSWFCLKSNRFSVLIPLEELFNKHKEHELVKKIVYNDILIRKIERKKKGYQTTSETAGPLFMKYIRENINTTNNNDTDDTEKPDEIFFPYEIKKEFLNYPIFDKAVTDTVPQSVLINTPSDNIQKDDSKWKLEKFRLHEENLENPKKWNYLEEDENNNPNEFDLERAGCDPSEPVSSVPCGGCGAFLHCQDIAIPGFIPKEAFENKSKEELENEICQRCLFLREFDVALSVNVSPSEYPEMLKQIRRKNCLAIIMIDILDFPCSYWSEISEIIGPSKPIVIVGNKIDLIKQEDARFLKHVKSCLLSSLAEKGLNIKNVKYVSLISAKTGFGVDILIDHLFKNWEYKGDVFLIGCTNVGKSTLFNTLVQSDYCSIKLQDIFQRATVSAWPGTTLKLLKFPITKPSLWHMIARKSKVLNPQDTSFERIPIRGYEKSIFIKNPDGIDMKNVPKAFNPENFDVNKCRWCFDTPGVVQHDQIINLLTVPELLLTLPKAKIIPRNFHLKPGMTLFIGGLARLDFVNGPDLAWFTVYASHELPVTITSLEDANLVYELLLGSLMFRVPMGGKERLAKWPNLSPLPLEVIGKKEDEADVDIVLSSAGWVAVNAKVGYSSSITAWTPEGRGIYMRNKALIKTGHKIRGERIRKTPAFRTEEKN